MKSVEQARDLLEIMNDKGAKWSHVIAKQYKKRIKSLEFAEARQENRLYNALHSCANCCGFTANDADKKLESVRLAIDELKDRYNELFRAFQNSKK